VPRKPQSHFTSRLNHGAVADLAEMRNTIQSASRQVLDARSEDRFSGSAPEPRAGLKLGHMPTALNLPFTQLINESGTFRTKDELEQLYREAGVDLDRPVTTTCGSGVTAAILTLGLTILGVRDLALYDGSWTEWGGRDDTEIVSDPV
jgi:thiosulfate/3-mercaptopyruvate sulfurtransferase